MASIVFVWGYNLILIVLIAIFGARLLIKTYENIRDEQTHYDYTEEDLASSSSDVFLEQLNITRREFWISFYIVELSLIAYFVFWGIMFYYGIRIV